MDYENIYQKQLNKVAEQSELDQIKAIDTAYNQKCSKPFHRQSTGLGVSIIDTFDLETLELGTITIPDQNSPTGIKELKIPQYIDRKVFYDYDKETKCFNLNDLGREMKMKRIEHNAHYIVNEFREIYFSLDSLYTSGVAQFFKENNIFIPNGNELKKKINNLIHGYTLDDLALYVLIYKDRLYSDVYGNKDYLLLNASNNYYMSLFQANEYIIPCNTEKGQEIAMKYQSKLCNFLPCFSGFDTVIHYINLIQKYYKRQKQLDYLAEQKYRSKTKLIKESYLKTA